MAFVSFDSAESIADSGDFSDDGSSNGSEPNLVDGNTGTTASNEIRPGMNYHKAVIDLGFPVANLDNSNFSLRMFDGVFMTTSGLVTCHPYIDGNSVHASVSQQTQLIDNAAYDEFLMNSAWVDELLDVGTDQIAVRFLATGSGRGLLNQLQVEFFEVTSGQTISGTVGEIASGENLPTDGELALVAAQTITGTVGEIGTAENLPTDAIINSRERVQAAGAIASGENLPTDAVIAAAVRQAITGTVGEIASAENLPTDAVLANVAQAITGTVGEIASAENLPTDAVIAIDVGGQTISGTVGEIASGESIPTDATLSFAARQTITGTVGEIASAESVPTDAVFDKVNKAVSSAGAIASAESVPTDATLANVLQTISGTVGEIASAENFPTDAVLALSTRLSITGTVGEIASAENLPTDAVIADVLLIILDAGEIPSGESIPTSHTVGAVVSDNPSDFASAGTATDANGAVHAVSVAAVFGGGVGDVYLAGTRHTLNGAMYVTFDAPDVNALYINGILHTVSGIRYVVDAAGSDDWPEGFSAEVGKLGTTTVLGGFYIRGITRTTDGRMLIDL